MRLANLIRPTVVLNEDRGETVQSATNTRSQPLTDAMRAARVETVRRAGWQELPQTRLVPRGRPGWLCDAETDKLYQPYAGALWYRGGEGLVPDRNSGLAFYVDADGDVVALEELGWNWSDVYARRIRRT